MAVITREEESLWKRDKTVGKGGFGIVSLASTSNLHDHHHHVALLNGVPLPFQIAVKSCKFSNSQYLHAESEFLSMFQESPYVIRSFGVNVTRENGVVLHNLLLEYASGGSLKDCLDDQDMNSRKGLAEYEVRKHTKNILLGLSHVHSKGVIHCDIKPHNILVVGTDRIAKIADFGLAMTLEESREKEHGIRGTKRYMAPESVSYHKYGIEVDIWALGCTVYELLTGKPLWETSSDSNDVNADVLYKITFEKPKIQNAKLSKNAQDFLKRCLVKDPRSRWTAEMLLNHSFLNTSYVQPTKKTKYMSLLRRIFKIHPHIRDLIKARIDAITRMYQKKLERELVEGY